MESSKTSRFGRKAMSLFLSGAMVVAFAPAVAAPLAEAADNGDKVTVTYAKGIGKAEQVASTVVPTEPQPLTVDGGKITVTNPGSAGVFKLNDYNQVGWYYDADGDDVHDADETVIGFKGDNETDIASANYTLDVSKLEGGAVTLKALFETPTSGKAGVNVVNTVETGNSPTTVFSWDVENGIKAPQNLTMTVTKDGEPFATASQTVEAATGSGGTVTEKTGTFAFSAAASASEVNATNGKFLASAWNGGAGAGTYEATLTDGFGNVLFTEEIEIDKLDLGNGQFGAGAGSYASSSFVLAEKGTTYADALNSAKTQGVYVVPKYPGKTDPTFLGYKVGGETVAQYANEGEKVEVATAGIATIKVYFQAVDKTSDEGSETWTAPTVKPTAENKGEWKASISAKAGQKVWYVVETVGADGTSTFGNIIELTSGALEADTTYSTKTQFGVSESDFAAAGAASVKVTVGDSEVKVRQKVTFTSKVDGGGATDLTSPGAIEGDTNTSVTKDTFVGSAKISGKNPQASAFYKVAGIDAFKYASRAFELTGVGVDETDYTAATVAVGSSTYDMTKSGDKFTYSFGDQTPATGTYTATLYTGAENARTAVGTATVELVGVAFDAGEGSWSDKAPAAAVDAVGNKMTLPAKTVVKSADTTKDFDKWSDGSKTYKAGDAYEIAKPASGDTVTLTATYKDAYVAAPTATYTAPESGTGNGTLALALAEGVPATDYDVKYSIGDSGMGNTYANTIAANPSVATTVYAKAAKKDASTLAAAPKESQVVATTSWAAQCAANTKGIGASEATPAAAFEAFADAALGKPTPADSASAHEYYKDVLKDAKKAGSDAVKANAFLSGTGADAAGAKKAVDKAWGEKVVEQEKALLAAIADTAKGTLAAKKAGKAGADGTVERISDDAYANAVAAIDGVLADFDAVTGDKAVVAKDLKTKAWQTAAPSATAGDVFAAQITLAVTGAPNVKVAKDVTDVEAEIAAIPAAPAADATEADKKAYADAVARASEDFGKLPEAQQAQVSAASVKALYTATQAQLTAAQADLEAAQKAADEAKAAASDPAKNEALKAAQDKADAAQKAATAAQANADAAAAKVTAAVKATKPAATVKAGKKKLTVKASKGTLEKLGKVTYKYRYKKGTKAGGTWKTLKVGKAVTVKKLKKGKKYTVQVKAIVDGTAAKTFKKTVKVK